MVWRMCTILESALPKAWLNFILRRDPETYLSKNIYQASHTTPGKSRMISFCIYLWNQSLFFNNSIKIVKSYPALHKSHRTNYTWSRKILLQFYPFPSRRNIHCTHHHDTNTLPVTSVSRKKVCINIHTQNKNKNYLVWHFNNIINKCIQWQTLKKSICKGNYSFK